MALRTPLKVRMAQPAGLPLILPTGLHGLRSTLGRGFCPARPKPVLAAEIDPWPCWMDAVDVGLGATLQPWAAVAWFADAQQRFHPAEVDDPQVRFGSTRCAARRTTSRRPPRWLRAWCWPMWRRPCARGLPVGAALHHDS